MTLRQETQLVFYLTVLTAFHTTVAMDCYVCRDCDNDAAIIAAQEGCLKCQKSLKQGIVYKRCVTAMGEAYLRTLGIDTGPGCRGVSHNGGVTEELDICFCENADMCNSAVKQAYFGASQFIFVFVPWMVRRVWLQ
ncbi:uncharacterized protein LOC106162295 [Lingula anatina]|uniref:Uncharacterized protein LOC106162295 n=1 Tax=Lingula anatina TaxID=7574 RepID=A0A1S3I9P3_LINAN|nr:uncharacterized protein LOC106162295 [Lingula anatina]XP_013394985.1 uncharacterized protein LOC106162295 [Lingula anatina]XP_013394996.1 uncharacterized protein LOC106162295 [Lingula anatina]|eukprot:XP_013394977.1 uncharacterized protein LOC106162295 [Lingula anatina]